MRVLITRCRQTARGFFLLLIATAALTAGGTLPADAGPASPAPAAWPTFHLNARHTGFNSSESVITRKNVRSLEIDFIGNGATRQPDLVDFSSPAVAGGLAYVGTADGQLLAFDATGCPSPRCGPVWRAFLGQSIESSPAVSGGMVYIATASRRGRLFAFRAPGCGSKICKPVWSSPLDSIGSSPTVVNGIVYIGSFGGGLYAFRAGGCGQATCLPLWKGTTASTLSTPAVARGITYIGATDGKVYAFGATGCGKARCQPLWTGQAGSSIQNSSPALANGVLFIGSFDGSLVAFNASGCGKAACQPLWKGTANPAARRSGSSSPKTRLLARHQRSSTPVYTSAGRTSARFLSSTCSICHRAREQRCCARHRCRAAGAVSSPPRRPAGWWAALRDDAVRARLAGN